MFEFANPGFLAAGGALVSFPIIIHLINRIRYKRVRWAAMEFLLKSQKKNRRRLIIEQLILLLLRCLLVILALMLVARLLKISLALPPFLGGGTIDWTLGPTAKQKTTHVVLLDDSPSMFDEVDDPQRSKLRTSFDVAREVIRTEIADNAAGSSTPQDLELVVLSQLHLQKDKYQPLIFRDLRDDKTREKLKSAVADLKCTSLHVPLLQAVTAAQKRADENKDTQVVVHLISDFRARDWSSAKDAKTLSDAVVNLAKTRSKVNLIDTAHPYRPKDKVTPVYHENLCISQFYPEARVVATNSLVRFNLTLRNYGDSEKEVRIALWDPETGKRLLQYETGVSVKVPKHGELKTSIEPLISREKDGFFRIVAALDEFRGEGKLAEDGVPVDNARHAAVYVRSTVPILIVDGDPDRGKQDGGDSYHIEEALKSAPGAEEGFDIDATGVGSLDQPNLSKYLSIFLVNVPSLSDKQLKNLETYVHNGGSVAFFMGKDVNPVWYNEHLYKNGKGLLPVELADTFTPPSDQPPLSPNLDDNQPKVLLRKDNFPDKENFPIFAEILKNPRMESNLNTVEIWRFFEIKSLQKWKPIPGEVNELATMPNLSKVKDYSAAAVAIREELKKLAETGGNEKYTKALNGYAKGINDALKGGKDCNELADVLGKLKTDRGDEESTGGTRPSLIKFLDETEHQRLRQDIEDLWKAVRYGSPLVLTSKYNLGRVVTVMTTAGKEWTSWVRMASYVTMILEMHSFMTSLGDEKDLTVGAERKLVLDKAFYLPKYKRTYPLSTFLEKKLLARKPKNALKGGAKAEDEKKNDGQEDEPARVETKDFEAREEEARANAKIRSLIFELGDTLIPGFYKLDLTRQKDEKNPEAVEERGYVFNLDTANESDLQRMSRENLMDRFQAAPKETIELLPPFGWGVQLTNRQTDFSQSPWFYLLFLLILVAEQAMAVHLSFHLRDNTPILPVQAVRSQALAG